MEKVSTVVTPVDNRKIPLGLIFILSVLAFLSHGLVWHIDVFAVYGTCVCL